MRMKMNNRCNCLFVDRLADWSKFLFRFVTTGEKPFLCPKWRMIWLSVFWEDFTGKPTESEKEAVFKSWLADLYRLVRPGDLGRFLSEVWEQRKGYCVCDYWERSENIPMIARLYGDVWRKAEKIMAPVREIWQEWEKLRPHKGKKISRRRLQLRIRLARLGFNLDGTVCRCANQDPKAPFFWDLVYRLKRIEEAEICLEAVLWALGDLRLPKSVVNVRRQELELFALLAMEAVGGSRKNDILIMKWLMEQ